MIPQSAQAKDVSKGGLVPKSRKRSTRRKTSRSKPPVSLPAVSSEQRLDILGVCLVGLALLTAVFLFKAEGESLPHLWILLLRRLFGVGAFVMPLVIAAPGVYLILRRFHASLPVLTPDRLVGIGLLFLGGLILVLCLSIPLLEWRRRSLSRFLQTVFQSEWQTLLLLGSSSLVLVRFYLAPGELSWAGDASQHLIHAHIVAQALARGDIPIWTNYLGTGSPNLQFYGFLFFYLVGLLRLLCQDLFISLKLVLMISHIASGLGMYCLVRQVYGQHALVLCQVAELVDGHVGLDLGPLLRADLYPEIAQKPRALLGQDQQDLHLVALDLDV